MKIVMARLSAAFAAIWLALAPVSAAAAMFNLPLTGAGSASSSTAVRSGSSASLYSFADARLRFPVETATITDSGAASIVRHVNQVVLASPAYDVTDAKWFFANWYQLSTSTSQEVTAGCSIVIDKLAIKVNVGGTVKWKNLTSGLPLTITTSDAGGWTNALTGVTIPANSTYLMRVAWHVPTLSGNCTVPTVTSWKALTFFGTGVSDSSQGDTEANASTITGLVPIDDATTQTNLNNGGTSRWLPPALMVAKGGDGRKVAEVAGDSISFGTSATTVPEAYTARGVWGFIPVGLDDAASSSRIAFGHFGIPGSAPTTWGSNKSVYWEKKASAVRTITALQGAPPFDVIINQGGENDLTGLMTGTNPSANLQAWYNGVRAEWPGVPIIQAQLLPEATSNDNFATLANQSVTASNTYPTGGKWVFNTQADVGGSLRAANCNGVACIDDSFRPWEKSAYDTGANRHKFAIRPFSTTLAQSYASGTTVHLVASPPVGAGFQIAGVTGWFTVRTVTGSAPDFTVTTLTANIAGTAAAGAAVQEIAHDGVAGVHPTALVHRDVYSASMIEYKQAVGW